MEDREAEVTVVETVDIPMGTMTIKAATQADIQGLKTILHPSPMGMIIQGLRSKSKLRGVWAFKPLLNFQALLFVFLFLLFVFEFSNVCRNLVAATVFLEAAIVIRTEVATMAPLMGTAAEHRTVVVAEALEAPVVTRCLT